jgi:hypothetical protein
MEWSPPIRYSVFPTLHDLWGNERLTMAASLTSGSSGWIGWWPPGMRWPAMNDSRLKANTTVRRSVMPGENQQGGSVFNEIFNPQACPLTDYPGKSRLGCPLAYRAMGNRAPGGGMSTNCRSFKVETGLKALSEG